MDLIQKVKDMGIKVTLFSTGKLKRPDEIKKTTSFEDIMKPKKEKEGGMKKVIPIVVMALLLCGGELVFAADISLDLQQGGVMTWDGQVKNMTGVKVYELKDDKPISDWPAWSKALLVGDCITANWVYDGANCTAAAVMVGRKLGSISQYVPAIKSDVLNQVEVHLYPLGVLVERDNNQTKVMGCSGISIKY